jgi:carbon monoxide dehydrogenase subunit G
MSMVQQAIEVSAPLHTVYEQLAAFENYPRFMSGVQRVTPIDSQRTHWVMDVDGKRREFDAQITELSFDERVSWATMDGPLLSETITVRPVGETRTQVVAQLEADIAFLMPSDRHGQETLNRRLKHDLTTFKSLVESGAMVLPEWGGASSKAMASPASVAGRIRNRPPHPGAGWGTNAGTITDGATNMGTPVDITSAPGIHSVADLDDALAPGRRIVTPGPARGGTAGTQIGTAPMGGRTARNDGWGDGMINEEDRGSAHDH